MGQRIKSKLLSVIILMANCRKRAFIQSKGKAQAVKNTNNTNIKTIQLNLKAKSHAIYDEVGNIVKEGTIRYYSEKRQSRI